MKKFTITALLIAGLVNINNANAQKGFSVSIKATPQFSFLQNEDERNNSTYEKKATINAAFGAGVEYGFNNYLGLGADVLYSLQGQRYKLNGIVYNQKVNYIKVPLFLTYVSNFSSPISFLGKIGPQVSFVSNANFANKDGDKIIRDTKDRYKTTTFGAAALAGVQYKLGKQTFISTAVRFDYDFANAEDDAYADYTIGRAKTYNSTIGLEVGLKYMIK